MNSLLLVAGIGLVVYFVFAGKSASPNQQHNHSDNNNNPEQQPFNRYQNTQQNNAHTQRPQQQLPNNQGQPFQSQGQHPNNHYQNNQYQQQVVTLNSGRVEQTDDKTDEYYQPFHGQVVSNNTRVYVASTIGREGLEEIFRGVRLRLDGKREGIKDHHMRDKDLTNYTRAVQGKSADIIISLAERDKDHDGFDFMQFLYNAIIQNYTQYEIDKITSPHGGIADIILRDVRYHGQSTISYQQY